MAQLKDGFLVISRVLDKDTLKGFLLVHVSGKVQFVTLDDVVRVGLGANYLNAKYDNSFGTLVGTHKNSLTKYPSITKDMVLTSKDGIIVLATILDTATKKPIGVVAYNSLGRKFNLTYKKLLDLTRKYNNCNFDIVNDKTYGLFAVQKDGSLFDTIEMSVPSKQKATSNAPISQSSNEIPVVKVYSMDFVKDNEFSQPCQDKLVRTMLNMQALTPYYATMLQAIKRVPAPDLGTMGVTEDKLLYDMKFVAQLGVPELTFVLIHEMLHIAMQHSARFGNRENHELWNVACDLYINTIICNDFGCKFGKGVVNLGTKSKPVEIKTPDIGVFIETIGETIDLATDTPESIYKKLLEENSNTQQGGQGNQQGGQSGQQGQQSGQQGQQGQQGGQQGQQGGQQGKQGNQQGNQKGQQGNQQGQQSGQPGQQSGQQGQQGNQQGQQGDNNGAFDSSGTVNTGNSSGDLDDSSSDGFEGVKQVNVVYNGKRLKGTIMTDVLSNKGYNAQDNSNANIESSKQALQRIATKIKLEEEKCGALEKVVGCGSGDNLVQRYIEFGLSAGVNWKVLLKNLCKKKPKKTFTLAQPNQDYMNMGITIADRRKIGKGEQISGIKFAVDVSGSVSEQELEVILSEINNIFNYYKVDGELIYWSTMVGDAGNFSSLKDLLKVNPESTGGTDVLCVFEYLSGKTKVNRKYEETKLKDISAIFIITDGCFGTNYKEYADLDRKVIWLITGAKGNPITFNPPFGKVVPVEL